MSSTRDPHRDWLNLRFKRASAFVPEHLRPDWCSPGTETPRRAADAAGRFSGGSTRMSHRCVRPGFPAPPCKSLRHSRDGDAEIRTRMSKKCRSHGAPPGREEGCGAGRRTGTPLPGIPPWRRGARSAAQVGRVHERIPRMAQPPGTASYSMTSTPSGTESSKSARSGSRLTSICSKRIRVRLPKRSNTDVATTSPEPRSATSPSRS